MPPRPLPGTPTPPIALSGTPSARLATTRVEVPDDVISRLRAVCPSVVVEEDAVAEASRDWWPLAMVWALDGGVAGLASVIARPRSASEVSAVLRVCGEAGITVTGAAGTSGGCGGG